MENGNSGCRLDKHKQKNSILKSSCCMSSLSLQVYQVREIYGTYCHRAVMVISVTETQLVNLLFFLFGTFLL